MGYEAKRNPHTDRLASATADPVNKGVGLYDQWKAGKPGCKVAPTVKTTLDYAQSPNYVSEMAAKNRSSNIAMGATK